MASVRAARSGAVVRAAAVLAVAGLGLTGCMSVGPAAEEKHGVAPVGQAGPAGRPGATGGPSTAAGSGHPGGASGRSEHQGGLQAENAPAGATSAAPGELAPGANGTVAGVVPVPGAGAPEGAPGGSGASGGANVSPAPHPGGSSAGSTGTGEGRSGGGAAGTPSATPSGHPSGTPEPEHTTPAATVPPGPEPSAGSSGSSAPSPHAGAH
ncbi:hypothetical protein ABTY61_26585 [Kitasatospora sp. NPDC096128]|uniref:hypothetical protein n=1 Tax=Kitasatospora sp. NPDC096128 TaxID=3155547 RepID=UPI0033208671